MSTAVNPPPQKESRRARATRVAWQARPDLTLTEWREMGPRLGVEARASKWWVGDWARFGYRHHGQSYGEAAQITGYDEQTLYNMAWVANAYDISRRREKVSWSHHEELVKLDEARQDEWLDRLETEPMTIKRLRLELKRHARKDGPAPTARQSLDGAHEWAITVSCPGCGELVQVTAADLAGLKDPKLIHHDRAGA